MMFHVEHFADRVYLYLRLKLDHVKFRPMKKLWLFIVLALCFFSMVSKLSAQITISPEFGLSTSALFHTSENITRECKIYGEQFKTLHPFAGISISKKLFTPVALYLSFRYLRGKEISNENFYCFTDYEPVHHTYEYFNVQSSVGLKLFYEIELSLGYFYNFILSAKSKYRTFGIPFEENITERVKWGSHGLSFGLSYTIRRICISLFSLYGLSEFDYKDRVVWGFLGVGYRFDINRSK